jgi:ribA/ribD-fused uncharacterized protein
MKAIGKDRPGFRGEYGFLSNFWQCDFTLFGHIWDCSERAFQWAKQGTDEGRQAVLNASLTGRTGVKAVGRQYPMTPEWDKIRIEVMTGILRAKFGQNQDLKERLLATGDAELVEGNSWNDRFWGVPFGGTGQNWLGKVLMFVRAELQELRNEQVNHAH